ncbi:7-carboxy-7-deazaguanine synthase QueE [Candidatus Omnitrophota bacterium]
MTPLALRTESTKDPRKCKAGISEIFSSIQGEGPLIGVKQIFVRFKKCNLRCSFCDTPHDLRSKEYSVSALSEKIEALERYEGPHHSVSLTGGEPLLYADFIRDLSGNLKGIGLKVYLETNGTLPEALDKVAASVDFIALDIKLPSSTSLGGFWEEHMRCLQIAGSKGKEVFVKAVVTSETKRQDLSRAASLMKKVKRDIPFILQPVTPVNGKGLPANIESLFGFLNAAKKEGIKDIRIIPQMHKILEVR